MLINKERDIYLIDGKLDLSILNEAVVEPLIRHEKNVKSKEKESEVELEVEGYNTLLDDLESIELKDDDISTTLQQMAMIFEQEDEYKKAFNEERLVKEMKEFE